MTTPQNQPNLYQILRKNKKWLILCYRTLIDVFHKINITILTIPWQYMGSRFTHYKRLSGQLWNGPFSNYL